MASKKRVKLPEHVEVCGAPIPVKRTKDLRDSNGKPASGTWDPDSGVIEIDEAMAQEPAEFYLRHELAHATWSRVGVERWLVNLVGAKRAEEVEEQLFHTWLPAYTAALRAAGFGGRK